MVEDCKVSKKTVKVANLGLENYVKESREHLFTAARSVDIDLNEPIGETTTEDKKPKKEKRTISWEGKKLHDQFARQTYEVGNQGSWQCLRNGTLKRETESLIFAAQEQAIRTNVIKERLTCHKSKQNAECVVWLMRQLTIL